MPSNASGVLVTESNALGVSAVWRAVWLISNTIASLPLRTVREPALGQLERVGSVFDEPGGIDGQTPYEWKESIFAHVLLHGNAFALKIRNAAGSLLALPLVHPRCVEMIYPTPDEYARARAGEVGALPVGGLWFDVHLDDGTCVRLDGKDVFHVRGLSLDGRRGISVLGYARQSLGTTIAGDTAQAKTFSNGAMLSGVVSPDDDLEGDDLTKMRRELDRYVLGYENAGGIAIVNRRMNFDKWSLSPVDAQFLQSRQFQIEEVARWFGIPPFELMQTEKQTSWGTGIESQQRGLGRTVLAPWATRVEQRASREVASPRRVEFDFSVLERPSPDAEIALLLSQTGKPIMTVNEARARIHLPPVEGGDVLDAAPAPAPAIGGDE